MKKTLEAMMGFHLEYSARKALRESFNLLTMSKALKTTTESGKYETTIGIGDLKYNA